jgi:hypothetical protein
MNETLVDIVRLSTLFWRVTMAVWLAFQTLPPLRWQPFSTPSKRLTDFHKKKLHV